MIAMFQRRMTSLGLVARSECRTSCARVSATRPRFRSWRRIIVVAACCSAVYAQQPKATELLARALHFADLYNWSEAAPAFTQAEQLFSRAGDRRNALYAKLGRIRSNIEREQQALPTVSAQLAESLDDDPLLQNDRELRMFCLIVKGDIDTETNTGAMRRDWEQVRALAEALGDSKWQYRALAQIGIAAFYDADLETARQDVGAALAAATKDGDTGAQIRFLTMLANGLVQARQYQQALPYIEGALKLAKATPDSGDQFTAEETWTQVLIGLRQFDSAEHVIDQILTRARETGRVSHEAAALSLGADLADTRNEREVALTKLDQAIELCRPAGLTRQLSELQARATEIYRKDGDLQKAERSADLAASSTQASGNIWALPQRLQALAEVQIAQGRYAEADRVYDRAEAFLDAMIGNEATAMEKTAVITASSQIYSQHFALVAEHFKDPQKAYSIIEQARGRVSADLLQAGFVAPPGAKGAERTLSQLRLKLMSARSTDEIRNLRDQIFMEEQSRWVTPGVSILKAKSREQIGLAQVQQALPAAVTLIEFVVADPSSYCLVISRSGPSVVRLASKSRIESLIAAYLKAIKAKAPSAMQARNLYDALLGPVREARQKQTLIIVRDGQLNLVPFDGLREPSGRYVVEARTIIYSPSASIFYLLSEQNQQAPRAPDALLAVGGIPYSQSSMTKSGLTRGYDPSRFFDLPASTDEVRIAQAAFPKGVTRLLLGASGTESAFKSARLAEYRVIHLAVHGFADSAFPDRAALLLLSDPKAGEDGFLQASEIVHLRLNADLVVLSACDTAVGPLEGQEGIANLSRAFLLAGARTVVSTLWQVDDDSSLFLMKHFYQHLSSTQSAASALTAAKRDMLRIFGQKALPYEWAGVIVEGTADGSLSAR